MKVVYSRARQGAYFHIRIDDSQVPLCGATPKSEWRDNLRATPNWARDCLKCRRKLKLIELSVDNERFEGEG